MNFQNPNKTTKLTSCDEKYWKNAVKKLRLENWRASRSQLHIMLLPM